MKTVIAVAGEFVREVGNAPIAALPESFHVQFKSQLRSAKNPDDWQSNFSLILKRGELREWKELIDQVLCLEAGQ
jgi:hypothetical protein